MLVCALPAAPAGAYHRQRQRELERLIREKRDQIRQAEQRENDLLGQIRVSNERETALRRQLDAIQARLESARDELAVLEGRADRLLVELQAKTAELESTLAELHEQEQQLNQHVAAFYMFGPQNAEPSLQEAFGLEDHIDEGEYGAAIVRRDLSVVTEIEQTKARIEGQRNAIENRRAQVEADRRDALKLTRQIAVAHQQRAEAKAAVDRELDYRKRLLRQVRTEKEAYERALASYKRESEDIQRWLRGRSGGGRVIQGRGGWLRWPISGRITSSYGWRRHPIYGYRNMHTGIDVSSPTGTPVRAARRGRVIYTGYRGAYGLVVIVDHGEGIASMYAHLSRVYVQAGRSVHTLDPIAAVGTTGWSTGPHLHFEVRSNGTPTNPMRWF